MWDRRYAHSGFILECVGITEYYKLVGVEEKQKKDHALPEFATATLKHVPHNMSDYIDSSLVYK